MTRHVYYFDAMKKIYSWNVNGIRAAAKKNLFDWWRETDPDVLCIQETKARKTDLVADLAEPEGYHAYFSSAERKGYSGVAVYSKEEPKSVAEMGLQEFDAEGRTLMVEFPSFYLISAYFPNSQAEGIRLPYKLEYCAAMLELCNQIVDDGGNVVLCGDYNIAHKPIDLANPKSNENNPGYLPEERAWMDGFTQAGYVDTFRRSCPEPGRYTWWSYRLRAREKNVGWRIDYHCVNGAFAAKVSAARIHDDVMGSDHCPVSIDLEVT